VCTPKLNLLNTSNLQEFVLGIFSHSDMAWSYSLLQDLPVFKCASIESARGTHNPSDIGTAQWGAETLLRDARP